MLHSKLFHFNTKALYVIEKFLNVNNIKCKNNSVKYTFMYNTTIM